MSYLKKNINLILLLCFVVTIGYLLTITTYYQSTYGKVTSEYLEQADRYEDTITNLEERERIINETSYELTRKTQDKEKLNQLYESVESQKNKLDGDLKSTKSSLASAQAELSSTKSDLQNKKTEISSLKNSLASLRSNMDDEMDTILDDLKDDYNLSKSDAGDLTRDLDDYIDDLKKLSE